MITLKAPARHQEEIKKSRFIAQAGRVDSMPDTLDFFERVRDSQATHNCWAFRIGQTYRFNDDGEPSGTAGKPILAAIDGQRLEHVMVVVTRYYGGIKLGVGGLIRAYGGCAAKCLQNAGRVEQKPKAKLQIRLPFSDSAQVYRILEQFSAAKLHEQFQEDGISLHIEVAADAVDPMKRLLIDSSRGRIKIRPVPG